MRAASRRPKGPHLLHGFAAFTLAVQSVAGAFDFGKADDAYGSCETFDIAREQKPLPRRLRLIESGTAGNGQGGRGRDGSPGRPGEMWVPGIGRKHFRLHQPPHPKEGLVKAGGPAIEHEGNPRIVEPAPPWSQSPHVESRSDAGDAVKSSFGANHNTSGPTVTLARNRSAPSSPAGRAIRTGSINRSPRSKDNTGRAGPCATNFRGPGGQVRDLGW